MTLYVLFVDEEFYSVNALESELEDIVYKMQIKGRWKIVRYEPSETVAQSE